MSTTAQRPAADPRTSLPSPSLWLVAGLLGLHQLVLTLIHFVLGPMFGLDPRSVTLTAGTIIGAAMILGLVVLRDTRRQRRAAAVLLVASTWNRSTGLTMLAGLVIAQIPLVILAAQGATVWQSGAGSNLAVGRALLGSLADPGGLLLILATVLVAPMIEEVLYRGYLAGAVMARSSATLAVIVFSLLFVTLHTEVANLRVAVPRSRHRALRGPDAIDPAGVGRSRCQQRVRHVVRHARIMAVH